MIITHNITMDLDRCGTVTRIDAAQGDTNTRQIRMTLSAGGGDWEIPSDVQALVRFRRPDGGSGAYDTLPDGSPACAVSGNVITAALMPQLFTAAGIVMADLCLLRETAVLSTFPFQIDVHPGAGSWLAPDGEYHNVSGFVPMPEPAAEGQFIRVTAVDEYGIVQSSETANVDDAPVRVLVNEHTDTTWLPHSASRRSFHLSGVISLGSHEGYRVNSLAVRAEPGSEIRFALFRSDRDGDNTGILTQIAVLGSAVADSETGVAALEFPSGYGVDQDNTVILALAAEPVIACYEADDGISVTDGIYFDDADYSAAENGVQIPCVYITGLESDPKLACYLGVCDIDFVYTQTLGEYIRETEKRLQNLDGDDCALPKVTSQDEGKFLRVVNGAWTAETVENGAVMPTPAEADGEKLLQANADGTYSLVAVQDSAVAAFVDAYLSEALGGDY